MKLPPAIFKDILENMPYEELNKLKPPATTKLLRKEWLSRLEGFLYLLTHTKAAGESRTNTIDQYLRTHQEITDFVEKELSPESEKDYAALFQRVLEDRKILHVSIMKDGRTVLGVYLNSDELTEEKEQMIKLAEDGAFRVCNL